MKISEEFLSSWCPATWLAKAFSEYALAAAEKATDTLEVVNELATNTDIEDAIETVGEEFSDAVSNAVAETEKQMQIRGEFNGFDINNVADVNSFVETVRNTPDLHSSLQLKGQALYGEDFDLDLALENDPESLLNADVYQEMFNNSTVEAVSSNMVSELCESFNITEDTQIPINDCYVNIKDACKAAAVSFNSPNVDAKIHIPGYDINGQSIEKGADVSYEDVVEQLKDSIASSTIIGEGCVCCASETLEESLASFESSVAQVIDIGSTKFSGTVAYVKNILVQAAGNADAFIGTMYDKVGGLLFEDHEFTVPKNTDMSRFTGQSPLLGFGLQGLATVGSAIGSTFIGAALAIWKVVKTIVPKAISKVGQAVWWMINPCDIEVCRHTNFTPVMDTLSVKGTGTFIWQPNSHTTGWSTMYDYLLGDFKISNGNKWISLETFTMQLMFRVLGVAQIPESNDVSFQIEYVIKPKVCRHFNLRNYQLSIKQPNGEYMCILSYPSRWAKAFAIGIDSYYNSVNTTTENDAYMGFDAAAAIGFNVGALALSELASQFESKYPDITGLASYYEDRIIAMDAARPSHDYDLVSRFHSWNTASEYAYYPDKAGATITNEDWFKLATGYLRPEGASSPLYCYRQRYDSTNHSYTNGSYLDCVIPYVLLFVLQQYDKYTDPSEYVFLPYCKESYAIGKGRFTILKDSDILDKVDTFLSTVAAVTIVASLAIITKKILRAIKIHKVAKWNARQGVLDNAMWNGAKLNRKQARQYFKAKRKVSKLDGGASGLAGAAPVVDTVNKFVSNSNSQPAAGNIETETDITSMLSYINKLIKGNHSSQ